MLRIHTTHKNHHHLGWDNAIQPILTVTPGEIVDVPNWTGSLYLPKMVLR